MTETGKNKDEIIFRYYEKTMKDIDSIVKHIKSYDYTPFEQLLHAYDIVRNINTRNFLSKKQLASTAFSNIFNEVVKRLGFTKANLYKLDGVPYVVSCIYVQDEKYNLDGIYYFDVAADVKRSKDDTKSLHRYLGFAKTKEQIDHYYKHLCQYKNFVVNPRYLSETVAQENKYDSKRLRALEAMNFFSEVVHDEKKEYFVGKSKVSEEETLEDAIEFQELLRKPIEADTFLEAFETVRKKEFSEQKQEYAFDKRTMFEILYNSDFIYNDTEEDKEVLIFFPWIRPDIVQRINEKIQEYATRTNLQNDPKQVKVYEKKTNE